MIPADYVVLRLAPCAHPDEFPEALVGAWLDLQTITANVILGTAEVEQRCRAVPTNEFEVRDTDGAVAEVYLIHTPVHTCG